MSQSFTQSADYAAFCQEQLQNPYPLLRQLREEDPVHWCAPMNLWLVTRYDHVLAGMQDSRLSSDRTGMYVQAMPADLREKVRSLLAHVSKWLQLTDDPDHARLRRLVSAAFTPRVLDPLRLRINEVTGDLLRGIPHGKTIDLVTRFCRPIPATIISEMLGIPLDQRDEFIAATDLVMRFSARGGPEVCKYAVAAHEALGRLIAMFETLLDQRRRSPGDDLLSALVLAGTDKERFTNEELYAMCVFLFVAGYETTTSAIGNGVHCLLRHPEQHAILRAGDESVRRTAIDEMLRYESPVPRAVRRAREDFHFGGRPIRAGQHVVLLLGAANRDPAQFPHPDRFDVRRQPNRHVAFGYGTHFCLGAFLARLEMDIALAALTRQLPNLRLSDEPPTWKPGMGIRALVQFPVRVD